MAIIDFGGTKEEVITRKEFPMTRARKVLKNETIAIIGYGVQGPAQALNLRDNGFKVIIGQAKKFAKDWERARKDGWVPGKTLFDIEEAVQQGTIIQMLVSDAAQRAIWPAVKRNLNTGNAAILPGDVTIEPGHRDLRLGVIAGRFSIGNEPGGVVEATVVAGIDAMAQECIGLEGAHVGVEISAAGMSPTGRPLVKPPGQEWPVVQG